MSRLRRPQWLAPFGVALLARWTAALWGNGFHARDDYFHVFLPGLRFADDMGFDWVGSELPGAGLRSYWVPQLLGFLIRGLRTCGFVTPEDLLSGTGWVLGTFSALVVPAGYLLMKNVATPQVARAVAWLLATYFALPFIGTRWLLGSIALVPVMWGIALATLPGAWARVGAGVVLGAACAVRYQVGALGLAVAAVLWFQDRKHQRNAWGQLAILALSTGAVVLAWGLYDEATLGSFLGSVQANMAYNAAPPDNLSRSHPFVYVLWLLALSSPPLTLWVVPRLRAASRAIPLVVWPLVAFLVAHSSIPHKEERFLFPALGLFLALMVWCLMNVRFFTDGFREKLIFRYSVATIVTLHLLLLGVSVTAQSQLNHRQALAAVGSDTRSSALISLGPEIQSFFLGRALEHRRRNRPEIGWLHQALDEMTATPNRFLAFEPDGSFVAILLGERGFVCEPPIRMPGSWTDRLVFWANPRRNRRRAPILLWRCHPPTEQVLGLDRDRSKRYRPPGKYS